MVLIFIVSVLTVIVVVGLTWLAWTRRRDLAETLAGRGNTDSFRMADVKIGGMPAGLPPATPSTPATASSQPTAHRNGSTSVRPWLGEALTTARDVLSCFDLNRHSAPGGTNPLLADFCNTVDFDRICQGLQHMAQGNEFPGRRTALLLEQRWFQDLLRAELLCRSYCPLQAPWNDIGAALGLATNALRMLLMQSGVQISTLTLPITISGIDAEFERRDHRLRDLIHLRDRIKTEVFKYRDQGQIAIDCLDFGYSDNASNIHPKSRLVVFNSAEWH